MAALICDICGGSLSMDGSGEFAVCDACGMKHSKERVRTKVQEVTGTVETVIGSSEKERLLANAETFLKLKQYMNAGKVFQSVSEQFPDDYRGWWGVCKTILLRTVSSPQEHKTGLEFSTIDCYTQNMKNAYMLCQDKEVFLSFFRELFAGYGGKIPTSSICPSGERSMGGAKSYMYMDKNKNELLQITVADASLTFIIHFSDRICKACPLDELKHLLSTLCREYESKVLSGEIAIYIGFSDCGRPGDIFYSPITNSLWERSEILRKKLMANREALAQLLCDYGAPGNIDVNDKIDYVFGPRIYYMYNPGWDGERYYVYTLSQPITEEMIDTAANTAMKQKRMQNYQCQHCGGEFKGLFNKSCRTCGKPKDY